MQLEPRKQTSYNINSGNESHQNVQHTSQPIPATLDIQLQAPDTNTSAPDGTRNTETDGCYFPTRYVIGIMALLSSTIAYIIRAGFPISLLAMVNRYDATGILIDQPNFGPRYDWTPYQQSLLLGAFHYSYPFSSIPSGVLIDKYGLGREFILVAFVLSAASVLLSPVVLQAAGIASSTAASFGAMFALRLLLGLVQGGTFPNISRLGSRWAPRNELGVFMVANHGSSLGTIVAGLMTGTVIETFGWQWTFYVNGILVLVFLMLWWWTVYDAPAQHPRIRPVEREFIERSVPPPPDANKKSWPPMRPMMTSLPFWSLMLLAFGNEWGLYFVMTVGPMFVNQVLGFNLNNTGLLTALPYIVRLVSAILFGFLGDNIRRRGLTPVGLTRLRKIFCICSHILPAVCLLIIPVVAVTASAEQRPYLCVGLLCLSYAFNGAVTQTAQTNYHDLTPAFAASAMAIVSTISSTSGFMSPLVVAYFTSERNTIDEWRNVFIVGAAAYAVPAVVFMCFGSAEDQHWGDVNKRLNLKEVKGKSYNTKL